MRNMFGWSLPPGCSMRDIDRLSEESPCAVCGNTLDDCICPECPVCTGVGDPKCYEQHGMVRTPEQIAIFAAHEAQRRIDIDSENAHYRSDSIGI